MQRRRSLCKRHQSEVEGNLGRCQEDEGYGNVRSLSTVLKLFIYLSLTLFIHLYFLLGRKKTLSASLQWKLECLLSFGIQTL